MSDLTSAMPLATFPTTLSITVLLGAVRLRDNNAAFEDPCCNDMGDHAPAADPHPSMYNKMESTLTLHTVPSDDANDDNVAGNVDVDAYLGDRHGDADIEDDEELDAGDYGDVVSVVDGVEVEDVDRDELDRDRLLTDGILRPIMKVETKSMTLR